MNAHPILHRLSVALAACALISLVAGALVTGTGSPLGASAGNSPWLRPHGLLAGVTAGLAVVTVSVLLRSDAYKWLKGVGLSALAVLGLSALLGLAPRSVATGVGHAVLSHALFSLVALLALGTSPAWSRKVAPLEDRGWPSLRSLAWLAPVAVLLQIALGAAYRYQVFSSIPHATWAFPVILLILMLAAFALSAATPEQHAELRTGAIGLMVLVCAQFILGVAAFLGRLDPPVSFLPAEAMPALRATHLGLGALVLGFTVALSAQILRCAVPAPDPASVAGRDAWTGNGRRG